MLIKMFTTKVNSYEDETDLFVKIDKILMVENGGLNQLQWFRGYQGLWLELRKFTDKNRNKV